MSAFAFAVFMAIQTVAAIFYIKNSVNEYRRRTLLAEEVSHILAMPPGDERHQRRMLVLKRLHDLEAGR